MHGHLNVKCDVDKCSVHSSRQLSDVRVQQTVFQPGDIKADVATNCLIAQVTGNFSFSKSAFKQ